MASAKKDFRKDMQTVLKVFYEAEGTVTILKAMHERKVPIDINNLDSIYIICNSLERDGYIEQIHDNSLTPVGRITGQGRIFFEKGGYYHDDRDRFDRMAHWFKNHKIVSALIFIAFGISSLWAFFNVIREAIQYFTPAQ